MFADLWDSTQRFFERFDKYPPDLRAQLRVVAEEHLEVQEAALARDDTALMNESADLIVTIIGLLLARGITCEQFDAAMLRVAMKNDMKTTRTHAVDPFTGKIRRLLPAEVR